VSDITKPHLRAAIADESAVRSDDAHGILLRQRQVSLPKPADLENVPDMLG